MPKPKPKPKPVRAWAVKRPDGTLDGRTINIHQGGAWWHAATTELTAGERRHYAASRKTLMARGYTLVRGKFVEVER